MYLHDWKESKREGMLSDFGINEHDLDGVEILLASYTYEDYNGEAFVLFKKGGKFYEVNAVHCSCYGLSEQDYSGRDSRTQWEPEETSLEDLEKRLEAGEWAFGFQDAMKSVLAKTKEESQCEHQ